MAKIISFINQKGGVGKTTSAVNTASYLAEAGKFVLLVDLDPQGNASSGLGIDLGQVEHSLYSTMVGNGDVRDAIVGTGVEGMNIIPATADLAGANVELVDVENREFRLYDVLRQLRTDYDYIIIDTAAGLHCDVITALENCDLVFSVTEPSPLGAHDLNLILELLGKLSINSQIILNRSDVGDKKLISDLAQKYNKKIIAEIPYSKDIVNQYARGAGIKNNNIKEIINVYIK